MLENNIQKAAIYCRIAYCGRGGNEHEKKVEQQKAQLRELARLHGCSGCTEYSDIGSSGLNLNRRGLAQMEQEIRAGNIHVVFAIDVAAISRKYSLFCSWMEQMKQLGVSVVFLR